MQKMHFIVMVTCKLVNVNTLFGTWIRSVRYILIEHRISSLIRLYSMLCLETIFKIGNSVNYWAIKIIFYFYLYILFINKYEKHFSFYGLQFIQRLVHCWLFQDGWWSLFAERFCKFYKMDARCISCMLHVMQHFISYR